MCEHEYKRSGIGGDIQTTNNPRVQIIMGNCIHCGTTGQWGWRVDGDEFEVSDKDAVLCELAIG